MIGAAISIAIAIAGENSFADVLESFLSIIGYTLTPWICIIPIEYYFFRHKQFPLEDWNNMKVIPHGIAGLSAVIAG